jgi:peptide/nickel transport system substrate-binding protein
MKQPPGCAMGSREFHSKHLPLAGDDPGLAGAGAGADRRSVLKTMLLGGAAAAMPWSQVEAQARQKVLRVAMTLSDIPQSTGQATGGAEGIRFMNLLVYDSLIGWDLDQSDKPTRLVPSLAESWSVDPATKTVWTFKLRQSVKFHDGSPFNAAAVVWNIEKIINSSAPQFDRRQAAQAGNYLVMVTKAVALDEHTVQITTKQPDGIFPYSISNIYFSSPARWEELGKSWEKFAQNPSGTGPWIIEKIVPRERAEFAKNAQHWNAKRIPKCDRLVLRPMPDATTRVSALLAGQVDFIEAPPPDAIPQLKAAGMQIASNIYPHIWPYMVSHRPDSPFSDIRIRKAANLAIDREGIVKLLGGLARPAKGLVVPEHPWFGKPTFDIKYDPGAARKLLADAGFSSRNPVKAKVLMSAAGSGQMQPQPMNELVQENLKEVGIEISLETIDWETLRTRRMQGSESPEAKGVHAINYSWAIQDPIFAVIGQAWYGPKRVAGYNWGLFSDPKADELSMRPFQEFDFDEQNKKIAELHAYMVDHAAWIYVVHDLNPRAMSPRVQGFVSAQNWFQDLAPVDLKS